MQLVLLDVLSREFRAGTTWLTTTPPSKRRHGFRPWHYHTIDEQPHSAYMRATAHEKDAVDISGHVCGWSANIW